jgi:coenzyme PQQ biosynthesis protein PqqD
MSLTPIAPGARPKISARARLQTDKISGKPMLLYPEGALLLNPTGQAIVSLCTGQASVQEILSHLAARYRVPAQEITPEVMEYLNRLRAHNLLELLYEAHA